MNNAAIAALLDARAQERAADRTISHRERRIRAGHYAMAAVVARAQQTPALAELDHGAVRAALGCGDKIARVVVDAVAAHRAELARLALGIVAMVELGQVAAGDAADVAATLGQFLDTEIDRLPAVTVARIQAAIAALRPAPVACECHFKAAGHGRSRQCSTDARRYAIRVYEPATDSYATYAACWACARHTVRLARSVASYPACSEVRVSR